MKLNGVEEMAGRLESENATNRVRLEKAYDLIEQIILLNVDEGKFKDAQELAKKALIELGY